MLDRDFIAKGDPPNGSTASPQDSPSPADAATLATIRAKAVKIVQEAINTKHAPACRLGLMEELAQEIIDLCPACSGCPPLSP